MSDASMWPGGIVHESLDAWIDRQLWTDAGKREAKEVAQSTNWAIHRHVWAKMAAARGWIA